MQINMRDLLIALSIMAILCLINRVIKKESNRLFYIGVLCFSAIMVIIFSLTGISPISGFHKDIRWDQIQLIPFAGIRDVLGPEVDAYAVMNIAGNILMFGPVGFLLPLLSIRMQRWYKAIPLGLLLSLAIEIWQLFLCRGTDVDDLILNTFGVVLGYLCYVLAMKLFPKICKAFSPARKYGSDWLITCSILVPVIVIIALGFWDRYAFIHI